MRASSILPLLSLCLVLCFGTVRAGQKADLMSKQIAVPLLHSLQGGATFAGALKSIAGSDSTQVMTTWRNCASQPNNQFCKFTSFVQVTTALFLIVFPIILIIVCSGFCCGRGCTKNCECCCKPCGQKHCGGRYPTREYPLVEKLVWVAFLLPVVFLLCLGFSAAGFAALAEGADALGDMLEGMLGIVATPAELVIKITNDTQNLKTQISAELEPVNQVFADLAPLKTKVHQVRTSLTTLQTSMQTLAATVEGCDSTVTPPSSCTGTTLLTKWNTCASGSLKDANGVGAALSTSGSNPTCKNAANGTRKDCSCCTSCHARLSDINATINGLPTDADIVMLNGTMPMGDFNSAVDYSTNGFMQPVESMTSSLVLSKDDVKNARKALVAQANGVIIGINVALWIPSWLALACILVALALGKKGSSCWWTAYVIACLWFIFLLLPLFGLLTIPAAFLEGTCEILPQPNGSSAVLVDIFPDPQPGEISVVDKTLMKNLLDHCLLPTHGYLWGIVNVTKGSMRSKNSNYDLNVTLSDAAMAKALHVQTYAAPFYSNYNAFTSFSVSVDSQYCTNGYTGPPSCVNELAQYNADLSSLIATMKSAAADVKTKLDELDTMSTALETKLIQAKNTTANTMNRLVNYMWELGSCETLATTYAGVQKPVCTIAHVFGSVWAAAFVCGILWFCMFFVICCTKKRYRQMLVPFNQEASDDVKIHTAQVAAEGHTGHVDGIPVATAIPVAQPVPHHGKGHNAPPPPAPERAASSK